jgi:hypothetical protein
MNTSREKHAYLTIPDLVIEEGNFYRIHGELYIAKPNDPNGHRWILFNEAGYETYWVDDNFTTDVSGWSTEDTTYFALNDVQHADGQPILIDGRYLGRTWQELIDERDQPHPLEARIEQLETTVAELQDRLAKADSEGETARHTEPATDNDVHYVECGMCGALIGHELGAGGDLLCCPECGFASDPCDFPDAVPMDDSLRTFLLAHGAYAKYQMAVVREGGGLLPSRAESQFAGAFTWRDTLEGHEYWGRLHQQWLEHLMAGGQNDE